MSDLPDLIMNEDGQPYNWQHIVYWESFLRWETIDTAPKMKNLLLWAATDISDDGEVKNWKMETGYWNIGAECWVWGGIQLRKYDVQPTHYMLLPPAPDGH
jgi:hypothetical protein